MSDQRDDRLDLLARVLGSGHASLVDRTALWAIAGEHALVPRVSFRSRLAIAASPAAGYQVTEDGIALVDVAGPLSKWASIWRLFGLTDQPTLGELADAVHAAHADPNVRGIMLRIDSPGGTVWGTGELADAVHAARERKPVHAYAQDQCCSAAYFIGSQAARLTSNRAADVGSIGVYMLLVDSSRMAEERGLRFIRIRSGEHKGVGVPGVEITEAEQQELQRGVDASHELFLQAITRGRPALAGDELAKLADGRCWVGQEAADLGLTDGVESFDVAMDNLRAATARTNDGAGSAKGNAMAENTSPAPAGAGTTTTEGKELEQLRAELAALKEANEATSAELANARHEAAVSADLAALVGKVPPAKLNDAGTRGLLISLKKAGDDGSYKAALNLVASCDASALLGPQVATEQSTSAPRLPSGLTPDEVASLEAHGLSRDEISRVVNTHGLN